MTDGFASYSLRTFGQFLQQHWHVLAAQRLSNIWLGRKESSDELQHYQHLKLNKLKPEHTRSTNEPLSMPRTSTVRGGEH